MFFKGMHTKLKAWKTGDFKVEDLKPWIYNVKVDVFTKSYLQINKECLKEKLKSLIGQFLFSCMGALVPP